MTWGPSLQLGASPAIPSAWKCAGSSLRAIVRWQNPALRADSLTIPHEDHTNQVLGFVRQLFDNSC